MLVDLLELFFIIKAWQKGWRYKALIPPAICMGFNFFLGMVIGIVSKATGASVNSLIDQAIGIQILLSIFMLLASGILAYREPSGATATKSNHSKADADSVAGVIQDI